MSEKFFLLKKFVQTVLLLLEWNERALHTLVLLTPIFRGQGPCFFLGRLQPQPPLVKSNWGAVSFAPVSSPPPNHEVLVTFGWFLRLHCMHSWDPDHKWSGPETASKMAESTALCSEQEGTGKCVGHYEHYTQRTVSARLVVDYKVNWMRRELQWNPA